MIDKKTFLELAGRLYDEANQPTLFGSEQEPETEKKTEIRKTHTPYRSYKPSTRLDNIASHYEVSTDVIRGVCNDIGINASKEGGKERISKTDVSLLAMVITKKFNDFNDACHE